jgi:hypothetical protein
LHDQSRLNVIQAAVAPLCSVVRISIDHKDVHLFAVGLKQVHSLEVRSSGAGFKVDLWRGPNNADVFIRTESAASSDAAIQLCQGWLENDAA